MVTVEKEPNPVDRHVGGRIRMRRRVLGISQDKLAEAVGLTFQQVQKYEKGSNRVSASRLFAIASLLQVPVMYFFEGLPSPGSFDNTSTLDPNTERVVHAFLTTAEGLELARRFPLIQSGRLRRQVLQLVRAMSEEDVPVAGAMSE